MTDPVKILVVDDHVLFRQGLVSLLNGQPDYNVVAEAGSVSEAVSLALKEQPEIILMDFTLPDGNGADAAKAILAERPETKIVFLTMHESDDFLLQAISSGAKGYLLKNVPVSHLLLALQGIQQDEAALSRKMTMRILDAYTRKAEIPVAEAVPPVKKLSPREIEILIEVSSGATNDEISGILFISANTVKNHLHNIIEKLGLKGRRELIEYAKQHGLIKTPKRSG